VCVCLDAGWCLVSTLNDYIMCACFRIGVSNTYCVVFLFCFFWSGVPYDYVAKLFVFSIFVPSVFSSVYSLILLVISIYTCLVH
jgi:hypothetical protein